MSKYLIRNSLIINEGEKRASDILISNGKIERIDNYISVSYAIKEVIGEGKILLPGLIDEHVHFREPGLTQKGCFYTESKAAIAGGVTSFIDMPNTIPPVLSNNILQQKFLLAAKYSLANFSFYMGTSNTNIEEVLQINKQKQFVAGIKLFLGSSTGNLLIDDAQVIERIFKDAELLVVAHCEDETIIKRNLEQRMLQNTPLIPADHAIIKDVDACYASSSKTVALAKKYQTQFHLLHVTTEEELSLLSNNVPTSQKRITAEACLPHLYFSSKDYAILGNKIKCNPSIKDSRHQKALWEAVQNGKIDTLATDHAPHLLSEKGGEYLQAHAGITTIQFALPLLLNAVHENKITIEKIVEKYCHAPATIYHIKDKGFIREGYDADMVLVDMQQKKNIQKESILSRCGWSPFINQEWYGEITHVWVNGYLVLCKDIWSEEKRGKPLLFNR